MKYSLLALAAAAMVASTSAAALTEEQYQFLFTKFTQQYNKSYEVSGVFNKFQTFKNNLDLILAHNAKGDTFTMGVNQFADLNAEEFSQFMGLKAQIAETLPEIPGLTTDILTAKPKTTSKDWSGKINAVKNQGQCGSCWAFSTMGSLEPAVNIATGKLYDFSEQFLVDCEKTSSGCNGGLMSNAFNFIKNTEGGLVMLAKDYPYKAAGGACAFNKSKAVQTGLTGYKTAATEQALADALQHGPVSIAVSASASAFQFYKSGIVTSGCSGSVDHGVTAIAVTASDTAGGQYITVRNSWGSSWGVNGNIKIALEGGNTCSIVGGGSMNVQPQVK